MRFVRSRGRAGPTALLSAGVTAVLIVITAAAWWAGVRWPPHGTEPPSTRTSRTMPATDMLRLLHDAEQLLLRSCMRRAGFDYHPVHTETLDTKREFPYVLDDPAWAERHGYGRAEREREREEARRDPNGLYVRSLPPHRRAQALAAANGPRPSGLLATLPSGGRIQRSDQGCVAGAQRQLYGDLNVWFQTSATVRGLEPVRRARVLADPGYARGLAGWARCMREAGHPYATPGQARSAALSATAALPRARETALAVAEARCARRTGFGALVQRLDDHHGAALRRRYRHAIDLQARLRERALPQARAVVATGQES